MIRSEYPIGVRPDDPLRTPEPDSYVRTDVRTNEEPDTRRCDLYVPDAHARTSHLRKTKSEYERAMAERDEAREVTGR